MTSPVRLLTAASAGSIWTSLAAIVEKFAARIRLAARTKGGVFMGSGICWAGKKLGARRGLPGRKLTNLQPAPHTAHSATGSKCRQARIPLGDPSNLPPPNLQGKLARDRALLDCADLSALCGGADLSAAAGAGMTGASTQRPPQETSFPLRKARTSPRSPKAARPGAD